jgi:hypothetical protein
VAGSGSTHHLAVVDEALISRAHSIVMLVSFFSHNNDLAVPLVLAEVLSNVRFAFATGVKGDHSSKVFEGKCLSRQTGGRRVFEQELFDAAADVLNAELCLGTLVSGSKEDDG